MRRAARRLGLLARLVSARCAAAPPARQYVYSAAASPVTLAPVEELRIAQRVAALGAPAPPRPLDEPEHELRRDVVVPARRRFVTRCFMIGATSPPGASPARWPRTEDRRRIVSLVEPGEQVLLEERVRPAKLVVPRRQEDLRPREREQRVA